MAKKEKIPSTPESRAQKLADTQEVRKAFKKTFIPALAVCLSLLLIYSVCYISFFDPEKELAEKGVTTVNTNNTGNNGSSSGSAGGSSSGSSSNDTANGGSSASGNEAAAPSGDVKEISASSSTADVVAYFNTAINKVKPSAKQITLNKETNSKAGDVEGNLPSSLISMANSLIESNMGDKDLSKLDPGLVNATTTDQKNKMFPVENESWSSKLTADDVDSATVTDNGSTYEIVIKVKADEPSEATAHGQGHNGKAFSVIMPTIVTENAGPASSIIKEVKTGHKDGVIKVTVDKATGNVTQANYHFVWTLSLKALGASISIHFGLDKDFTIAW